jgi:hypothetical protein
MKAHLSRFGSRISCLNGRLYQTRWVLTRENIVTQGRENFRAPRGAILAERTQFVAALLQSFGARRITTFDFGRTKPILIACMSSCTRYFWQNEANLIGKGLNASRAVGPQRSSKMTLPSFGRVPIGTSSTDPLSFVTPRSVAATSLRSASLGEPHSHLSVITSVSPARATTRRSRPSSG